MMRWRDEVHMYDFMDRGTDRKISLSRYAMGGVVAACRYSVTGEVRYAS